MPKIPDCDRCFHNDHSNYLVCEIHTEDVDKSCPDVKFRVTYETDHVPKLTRAQQYQILMTTLCLRVCVRNADINILAIALSGVVLCVDGRATNP